jgi:hypothetical protein
MADTLLKMLSGIVGCSSMVLSSWLVRLIADLAEVARRSLLVRFPWHDPERLIDAALDAVPFLVLVRIRIIATDFETCHEGRQVPSDA